MRYLKYYLLFCLVFPSFHAASAQLVGGAKFDKDDSYYLAALKSFDSKAWANATKWFNRLLEEYPDFEKRSKVVLLLAQSLYKQENIKEAYGILSNNKQAAGKFADEYIYWMAECRVRQGNYAAADQHFNELLALYPSSERVLEATVNSAFTASEREDWPRVISLLRPADSAFQIRSKKNFDSKVLQEGGLLLAKALLEQKDGISAELLLDRLPESLGPESGWRRSILYVDILIFNKRFEEAITEISRLREVLRQTKANSLWQLSAARKHSQLLEAMGDLGLAAEIYNELIGEGIQGRVRAYSCLDASRLYMMSGKFDDSLRLLKVLESISDSNSTLALSHLLIGEIQMSKNQPLKFEVAQKSYKEASKYNIQGDLGARIHMRVGECFLGKGEYQAAVEEFHKGMDRVNDPVILARINYLDGLAKVNLGRLENAKEVFSGIVNMANPDQLGLGRVKDCANWMWFKSAVEQSNLIEADSLLKEARKNLSSLFPYFLLGMAQARITAGQLELAEEHLIEFNNQKQDHDLFAAAELEAIRVQTTKGQWGDAIRLYDRWLKKYPNHKMRGKVLLDRAWALMRSGQKIAAMKAYENLAFTKVKSPQVYTAKIWLADQYFNSVTNRLAAEKIYQEVASETNCPPYLRHRSQLMAGRAAMVRQGYDDAKKSFVALINNKDVSAPERIQATFALGDLIMFELKSSPVNSPQAEKIQNEKIHQSTNTLFGLTQIVQTNRVAARAWGRIGDISLMVARKRESHYAHAKVAYEKSRSISEQQLINLSGAGDYDDILYQALMGLAYCSDRSTIGSVGEIRKVALEDALKNVTDVYEDSYGHATKKINLYWRGQSGVMAIRFLTELDRYDDALRKYDELETLFPNMRPFFKEKKQRLEELRAAKP